MSVTLLLGAKEVEVRADSQVVVSQVLGQYATNGEKLKKYLQLICKERDHFLYFYIRQGLRGENQKTDRLEKAPLG